MKPTHKKTKCDGISSSHTLSPGSSITSKKPDSKGAIYFKKKQPKLPRELEEDTERNKFIERFGKPITKEKCQHSKQ